MSKEKEIKVKNKNQKGGITDGIINVSKIEQLKENKGMWANPYFKYILIPLIVGLIILGLTLVANKNTNEVYDVESYNQSGGITAGKIENVNIGEQTKHFNSEFAKQIEANLPSDKNKTIVIDSSFDGRAYQYANEMKQYFIQKGWKIEGVGQRLYANPLTGINMYKDADGDVTEIVVFSLD